MQTVHSMQALDKLIKLASGNPQLAETCLNSYLTYISLFMPLPFASSAPAHSWSRQHQLALDWFIKKIKTGPLRTDPCNVSSKPCLQELPQELADACCMGRQQDKGPHTWVVIE